MRLALPLAGAVAGGVALVLGLAVLTGGAGAPAAAATAAPTCVTSGSITGLSAVAATNARLVTAAAERAGGPRGAVIAVMVGYTESGLRVLGNPTAGTPNLGQGDGFDHDSIGIFQQRATWGTEAQRLDPQVSTDLFMARLLADRGWQYKAPWAAAQDVQVSAWDGRPRPANGNSATYGGNYAANFQLADKVVAGIDADTAGLACGALHGGLPASTAPGSHGLPASYTVPPSATPPSRPWCCSRSPSSTSLTSSARQVRVPTTAPA